MLAITKVPAPRARGAAPAPEQVGIELFSQDGLITHSLGLVLDIGGHRFLNYQYSKHGSLQQVRFVIPAAEFRQLGDGAPVAVYAGHPTSPGRKSFGRLDKSLLGR